MAEIWLVRVLWVFSSLHIFYRYFNSKPKPIQTWKEPNQIQKKNFEVYLTRPKCLRSKASGPKWKMSEPDPNSQLSLNWNQIGTVCASVFFFWFYKKKQKIIPNRLEKLSVTKMVQYTQSKYMSPFKNVSCTIYYICYHSHIISNLLFQTNCTCSAQRNSLI